MQIEELESLKEKHVLNLTDFFLTVNKPGFIFKDWFLSWLAIVVVVPCNPFALAIDCHLERGWCNLCAFISRTQSFGHTGQWLKWWSVRLLMMFAFFYTSTINWWKSWMKNHYGISLFEDHSTVDVSASMIMTMLIGRLSPPFQVLALKQVKLILYVY